MKSPENKPLESGELQARFDVEFNRYTESQIQTLRRDYESLVKKGHMRLEEIEPKLNKKLQEFYRIGLYEKIMEVLNNFRFWWPGGWYRELLEERKGRGGADQQKIAANKKLIGDLDQLIHDRGYESISENIATGNSIDRETQLKVLLEIYFAMLDKGYDRSSLVR